MALQSSRRSSTEDDYRDVFEAAMNDRLRDGIEEFSKRKKPKWHQKHLKTSGHDQELSRIATNLSNAVGISSRTLADIDPRLDPKNENFEFRFWASSFLRLLREDGIKRASVGFTFKNLSILGNGSSLAIQPTVASPFKALLRLPLLFKAPKRGPQTILHNLNGSVDQGEMLLVLGRPGSGCTTFLKSISGQLNGLTKSSDCGISYDGIAQDQFLKNFRGRAVYNQEDDEHFPHLTVEQTISFAAAAMTPQTRIQGVSREAHTKHMCEVMLRIFGLSHARHTKVGNDTIRGVSGGERKRVSIAEMALARSSVAVWDNSTRGLDSATALEFIRSMRTLSDLIGLTQCVAVYQASQSMYDLFDKTLVLYEGRQVYFGPSQSAKSYFERMGWYCPARQTTPDFLTSVTNPSERQIRHDHNKKVPLTAIEFEQYWQESDEYRACMAANDRTEDVEQQEGRLQALREAHQQAQAHHTRGQSPYLLSVYMQIRLCMKRSSQLLWNDRASTITLACGRIILALIVGSIYFGPADTTASLHSSGSVIFLATLMNALMAVTEIGALFAKRGILEKQGTFAFYHPFTDALAAFVIDIPVKFIISILFNVVYYFLAGLTPEASKFFIFVLFTFTCTLLMSAIFRSVGAACKAAPQAYAIAGIGILIMIIYTGFALQSTYMHPWFRWINYINPIAYVFEALLVNEVHGKEYLCATDNLVPPYASGNSNFACAFIGAEPNERVVSGDQWVNSAYGYSYSHIWRNLGISILYLVVFLVLYLALSEFKSYAEAGAQRLVFRSIESARLAAHPEDDVESKVGPRSSGEMRSSDLRPSSSTKSNSAEKEVSTPGEDQDKGRIKTAGGTLTWHNLCLDIQLMGQRRRLLDGVSGMVLPGKLTCLMGVSGAGKTTLLDTLAQRQNTVGEVSGSIAVDGEALRPSFQRKTGYVQQQDLHMATSTVREALRFSALLRQPAHVSKEEKYAYVEEVMDLLNMQIFGDALVGRPGEGLNIEQRKLLTIGVELAARPSILFLDEPTSGLDSQSSWTIISILRKLADNGQAILATIHQPSAMLFEQFDSILLLAKGGRTTYYGPLGLDCQVVTTYFESHGARACSPQENPAEYILAVIANSSHDWPAIWKSSERCQELQRQVLGTEKPHQQDIPDRDREFALSFFQQFRYVFLRVAQQYWRSPGYIYAKVQFGLLASLFIGFTFFLQNSSITGMQNIIFAIYMLNSIFSTVVNQIMSRFIPQRALFEVRESPSRMYSWLVFVLANVLIELPYHAFISDSGDRAMMWAFCLQFMLYASTWAQMLIFCMPSTETAGTISNILFTMTLQFNGVLQPPNALPGFWIFMYRLSPFTYLIGGFAGIGLGDRQIQCAENELGIFDPPSGQTCGQYLAAYLENGAPGTLLNPTATVSCEYCPLRNADQFLASSWIYPSEAYRNLGILFAFIGFNVAATLGLYYIFRVRRFSLQSLRRTKPEKSKEEGPKEGTKWSYLGFYVHLGWGILRNMVR
ncbi:hypothetical protein B0A52_06410 [Exophiala mesophila]|uniref:ABC transporter domain-containing protein n=1 Tax=Exophiala mesophila TaxID=212818 RepID=A0A438N215_EXOME|nr:hypothetical protein B0A52_06410 [Exophiala mesophila]